MSTLYRPHAGCRSAMRIVVAFAGVMTKPAGRRTPHRMRAHAAVPCANISSEPKADGCNTAAIVVRKPDTPRAARGGLNDTACRQSPFGESFSRHSMASSAFRRRCAAECALRLCAGARFGVSVSRRNPLPCPDSTGFSADAAMCAFVKTDCRCLRGGGKCVCYQRLHPGSVPERLRSDKPGRRFSLACMASGKPPGLRHQVSRMCCVTTYVPPWNPRCFRRMDNLSAAVSSREIKLY